MKISIIVPVYNVEKYLKRCVESITAQTYQNIEIILVNDGSTDTSGQLCDELKNTDPRILVIHKANGGLSSARNAGLDIATGDYVGFVDSDDSIEPDMFELLITSAEKEHKDIACCGRIVDLYGEGSLLQFILDEPRSYSREEAIEAILYLQDLDVSACDKLYKRELFAGIRYPYGRISEDAAVIFDILHKSNGVVHVGKPLYHYYFRRNSISKSSYNIRKFDVYRNMEETFLFVNDFYPQYMDAYKIYCSLNVSPLLQQLQEEQAGRRKYAEHYKTYMKMFLQGYLTAIKSPKIPVKTKVRFIAVRMHMGKQFSWLQKVRNTIRFRKNLKILRGER